MDIEFLENYIKEIANHEYGHTITLRSIFCLFPKDNRHILMEKNIKDITKDDLTRCYVDSKCYPLEFHKLQNIDLQIFEEIFLDFWANMMVCDKIDDNPPEQILNERLNGFYGITPIDINRKTSLKLLLFTQLFFIHDRWHILEEIMRESELDKLLWLYKCINVFYNNIIKFNGDFDSMEEDLVELARNLETLNYSEIIFKNRITNQDKTKLRTFINRLREKETQN